MSQKKRVVIFISGRGSNMQKLIEASNEPDYSAKIVGIISNKSDAKGLEFAKSHGIDCAVIKSSNYDGKAKIDAAISKQLAAWSTDLIALAGYMRLLGSDFCQKWQGKIINIHPSLLPLYKGLDTHKRALIDGATEHGCTVHFVTPEMDDGPIIGQVKVPIMLDDDETSLTERVLKAEHKLYPWALEQVASGKIKF